MFKNIRNNWCPEKTRTTEFQNPQTKKKCIAKPDKNLQGRNRQQYSQRHKIRLYNTSWTGGMQRTHIFVQLGTGTWNILNSRSPDVAKHTKNPNREKFIDPNDYRCTKK